LGPVDDGADGVLDAIAAAVGPSGTILMTLGARDDWAWVNERPAPERSTLLRGTPPFDAATTPADPDVGVLAEVFRTRSGTLVSDHPEGRFGARGALAEALVRDVPRHDYYGPGSPLERFVDAGGKVVRLGADPGTTTVIHYAEYLAPIAEKRRVLRHRVVDGGVVRPVECLDDCDGIVDHAGEDYFATILHDYLATGRAHHAIVGTANSELIDARDLVHFAVDWMVRHLR
jgi:aminoglycoside N3'-acetyltransferase